MSWFRIFGLIFLIVIPASGVYAQSISESLMKAERMGYVRQMDLQKKGVTGLSYDLKYHHLKLQIDPSRDSMVGSVYSLFSAVQDNLDEVVFDLRSNMVVDSVRSARSPLYFRRSGDLLYISLTRPLFKGETDSVEIFYRGNPVNNPYNSYEREKRRPKNSHPAVWTLSQPYGAHAWWPCKESLDDKIDSVDVWISIPRGNKAASLGILTDTVPLNDSMIEFRWRHRYPVATYLISVAISNYSEFTDLVHWPDGDSMPVLNYLYPEYVASGREPAKAIIPMLHLFDSLFGPYPFRSEKYGHAQMLRSGGMEHQTMSSMSGLEYGLMAHELAHQWFGNKITCASWSDLWLNEGFATYLSYLAYEFLQTPELARKELERIRSSAMSENSGSVYVQDTMNVQRLFSGRLTYSKGALLLHMLRWKLGDEAFFGGLRNYISDQRLRYGTARTSDLQEHLELSSGLDLDEFFSDWFYGEGYPSYIIQWRMLGTEAEVRIEQLANAGVGFFEMPLPFRFSSPGRDTLLRIDPRPGAALYRVFPGFQADSLHFDPELRIMARAQVFSSASLSKSMFLYPVPAKDLLQLRHNFNQISNASLYDMSGRFIRVWQYPESESKVVRLDINDLAPGTYLLEIEGDTGIMRTPFIKTNP